MVGASSGRTAYAPSAGSRSSKAGYCAAPTSGRGTSQALVGAYLLAHELADAAGDHESAFAAYEAAMRDYVAHNQEIGVEGSRYVFAMPTQGVFDAMAAQAGEAGGEPEMAPDLDRR